MRSGATDLDDGLVTEDLLDVAEPPGGLPKNFPRPCLLLFIAERPSHGYDLLERFRKLGVPAADPGGLYRALRQMERERLVSSCWETSTAGPARRTYTLTDGGWQWLHVWASAIAEGRLILSSYLNRYEALTANDQRGQGLPGSPTPGSGKAGAAIAQRAR